MTGLPFILGIKDGWKEGKNYASAWQQHAFLAPPKAPQWTACFLSPAERWTEMKIEICVCARAQEGEKERERIRCSSKDQQAVFNIQSTTGPWTNHCIKIKQTSGVAPAALTVATATLISVAQSGSNGWLVWALSVIGIPLTQLRQDEERKMDQNSLPANKWQIRSYHKQMDPF